MTMKNLFGYPSTTPLDSGTLAGLPWPFGTDSSGSGVTLATKTGSWWHGITPVIIDASGVTVQGFSQSIISVQQVVAEVTRLRMSSRSAALATLPRETVMQLITDPTEGLG